MKTTLSVFILCFTLLAFRVHSQNTELDPGWQWGRLAHVFNSVWNGKMCTDFNNNIFQYCNYRYSITIEDTSFYHDGDNPNHRNIAVIKRNAVGDFVKAVDMYTADEGNVFRNFLAVDKESNVYVYGAFTDTLFVNDQLVLPKYISFQPDIFLVKLDNNLEFLWAKIFAALYQDDVRGLDVSADNFIYITLRDYGSGGNRLVKLDPEGQMQWELQFTAVQGGATDISETKVGEDGYIYVTGMATKDLIIQGDTIEFPDNPGQLNASFIAQIDPDGNHHNAFFNPYAGLIINEPWLRADKNGNYIFSGIIMDTIVFGTDTINASSAGRYGIIAKMDPFFNPIWYELINSNVNFQVELINDSVAFAFYARYSFTFLGQDYSFLGAGRTFTGMFGPDKELLHLQIIDGENGTQLSNLSIDNCRNFLIDGMMRGHTVFESDTLEAGSVLQQFMAKNNRVIIIPPEMPGDTASCGLLTLNAPGGYTYYEWNGNLTNQPWYVVENSGKVHLRVADEDCCWSEAETDVTIYPSISLSLGPDFTMLLTDSLELNAPAGFDTYLWSTGDTVPNLEMPASELAIGNNVIWLEVRKEICSASDTINVLVIDNSSIQEYGHHDLEVFPNPAKDHIQLVTESMNLITKCSFIDQSGTTILSVKPDNSIIDVSGLAQGFYILKIDFTMEPVWRKIIVIR